MKTVGIGIIGSGFMGKAHAWGYRNVGAVFPIPVQPVLEILADATPELAATAARALGFARSTANWRELIADPKVDIVNITTPPQMHAEMALAAAKEVAPGTKPEDAFFVRCDAGLNPPETQGLGRLVERFLQP